MTTFDNSTFKDVEKILKKYKLWSKIPKKNIRDYITLGLKKKQLETPKKNNLIFKKIENTLVGSNNLCLQNIDSLCKKLNIRSKIWFKNIDGDVKKISKKLSDKLKNLKIRSPLFINFRRRDDCKN